MTIKIEEGKFYRTRSGQKIGPVELGTSMGFPWRARQTQVEDGCIFSLTSRGRFLISESPHPLDVVAEWADEPAAQQKDEPGRKDDADKARLDLIAPEFLFATGEILAFGAAKYAPRNWELGMSWGRCFGALMRHLWAWWGGSGPTRTNFVFGELDAETGKSHLWHASCCLMFLVAYEQRKIGTDDRTGS